MKERSSVASRNRNQLLDDLASYVASALLGIGIGEDAANLAGDVAADEVAAQWGGQLINIPKDHHRKLSDRNRQILEDFDGTNHSELARKYGLSTSSIYKLISKLKKERRREAQAQDL